MIRLEISRKVLIDYLKMKVELEDWHGVADAAMDLRELEIKLKIESKNYDQGSDAKETTYETTAKEQIYETIKARKVSLADYL